MSMETERERMVSMQLEGRGIEDARVLAAMRSVPRHEFVPPELMEHAYLDEALPIGEGQTISQPYIVALMSEALQLRGGERVLEIGTGSGYQAAILATMGAEVFTIERLRSLADAAERRLRRLGYDRVRVRCSDGNDGWPDVAPFDAVLITAAAHCAPPGNKPLPDELANCAPWLDQTFDALPDVRVVVCLGGLALDATLRLYKRRGWIDRLSSCGFAHAAAHVFDAAPVILCSYHPSQQNTFTGRLTDAMLLDVFKRAAELGRDAGRRQ